MKRNITILSIALFATISSLGQQIVSGVYDSGLRLSYDKQTKKITGHFESYTGLDETTNNHKFSCIFYIEGVVTGKTSNMKTYYPTEESKDLIEGTLEIINDNTVTLKLSNEHGGCWNVQHFADEPITFSLEKKYNWLQLRYVDRTKAYLFSEKSNDKKLKSYLIKGDVVCVEKIENDWVYCSYFGNKVTKGWLKLSDLNKTP